MANFLTIPITNISKTAKPQATKTFLLDFENCRMTSRKIDGIEAVNQFIRKAFLTPRFKCLIYSVRFGSAIKQLVSTSPSEKFLSASIRGVVEDAIIHDPRILSINSFEYEFVDGDGLLIDMSVQTIYGDTQIKEVYY